MTDNQNNIQNGDFKPQETVTSFSGELNDCVSTNKDTNTTSINESLKLKQDTETEIEISTRPANVFDVATYILEHIGPCSSMKLHKLLYYCQAWSLVWDDKPLFDSPIEAWANGPVVRTIFNFHKGLFLVNTKTFALGNPNILNTNQIETIKSVLDFYGNKPTQWLADLTHSEDPWIKARVGLTPTDRGSNVISLESMAEYYSSL